MLSILNSPTLHSLILGFLCVQGLLTCTALYMLRNKNSPANKLMLLLVLIVALFLLRSLFWRTETISAHPHILATLWPLNFAIGPLLYFYTLSTIGKQLPHQSRFLLHFLPVLVSALVFLPIYLLSTPDKADLVNMIRTGSVFSSLPLPSTIIFSQVNLAFVSFAVYCVFSYRLIVEHRQRIADEFSYFDGVQLTWLRYIIAFCFVTALFGLGMNISFVTVNVWPYADLSVLHPIVLGLLILTAGIFGVWQPAIFHEQNKTRTSGDNNQLVVEEAGQSNKYAKSGISPDNSEMIKEALIKLMEDDKVYLDSKLSLSSLSEQIGFKRNYVSQAINASAGCTFYDFINGFRVEESKRLLADPNNKRTAVIDIAVNSGFNNKASFYNAFKKHVGMTPIEYRNEQLAN